MKAEKAVTIFNTRSRDISVSNWGRHQHSYHEPIVNRLCTESNPRPVCCCTILHRIYIVCCYLPDRLTELLGRRLLPFSSWSFSWSLLFSRFPRPPPPPTQLRRHIDMFTKLQCVSYMRSHYCNGAIHRLQAASFPLASAVSPPLLSLVVGPPPFAPSELATSSDITTKTATFCS